MTLDALRDRDRDRLSGVHPELRAKVLSVLAAMDALGHPMTVTDAVRTQQQQMALFAKGRQIQSDGSWKVVGPTVTNCDGIDKASNHQPHADGFGHAVDCAFLVQRSESQWEPEWAPTHPWAAYGACAKAVGLNWGGAWTSFQDQPHVELP